MKSVRIYLLLHILTAGVLVHAFHPVLDIIGDLWSKVPNPYENIDLHWIHLNAEEIFNKVSDLWRKFNNPHESCDSNWISFNAEGLKADLESKLFGQHIASRIILNTVDGFINDDNLKKPLVLSLHGPPGTGKNFVSELIAENIYKEGMDSSFVHLFIPTFHFPHNSEFETYKSQLQQWIKGNVTNCARSMFIFDEVDKMHPGLIDSILPYLGSYSKLDGVSYRKAIFIFLSNAGGKSITQTALDFYKEGRTREDIKLKDLEISLSVSAVDGNNGGLINRHLVDFFVPFLPLEYEHVIQCIMAEMKTRGLQPNRSVADEMVRDLVFFPKTEGVFSAAGCKTIASRIHFYI